MESTKRASNAMVQRARPRDSANLTAISNTACPAAALNWAATFAINVTCGYVTVPLDWNHPKTSATISIYFEQYAPTRTVEAQSALLFNFGGPGEATTTNHRGIAFNYFGQLLDTDDFLLIDDRGRGNSTTIICNDLQHATAPFTQAEAECAAQLGVAASLYGTGEIAQDTDAVRAALGYDKVDYFGWSYGGADVEAYATRFGKHLRSIVADSPFGTPAIDPLFFDHVRASNADPRLVRLDCQRSPNCSADHPFPDFELALLTWYIRNHPVEGTGNDFGGNPTNVRIDEQALLNWIVDNPEPTFLNTGELLAAGAAVYRGDTIPLLRLAAEQHFALGFDFFSFDWGDPTSFSAGAQRATGCVDLNPPWDWATPPSSRQESFDDAIQALPWDYFAPFSKQAANSLPFDSFGSVCLYWEKPTPSSPIAPPHARYPNVPTLVVSGDFDNTVPLELTSSYAALYPNSTFVNVAAAAHGSFQFDPCASNLESQFIRTLTTAGANCDTPNVVYPAVGRFPRLAKEARPAEVDPSGQNAVGLQERKVATVAVATATDAMIRGYFSPTANAVGLRGGTLLQTNFDGISLYASLTNCQFAEDVTVNGTMSWSLPSGNPFIAWLGDGSFSADLTVSGTGTQGGTLHVQGTWQQAGPVGNFKVTGTLGGQNVALLVPEA